MRVSVFMHVCAIVACVGYCHFICLIYIKNNNSTHISCVCRFGISTNTVPLLLGPSFYEYLVYITIVKSKNRIHLISSRSCPCIATALYKQGN